MPLSMSRIAPLLGICVLAVAFAAGPASAATPYSYSFPGAEEDFCGTGVTVETSTEVTGVANDPSTDPNGVYRNTRRVTTVYTNPLNGNTVTEFSSGQYREGPGGGFVGLDHQLRAESGAVLLRDTGSWDEHFCEVMVDALGLPQPTP